MKTCAYCGQPALNPIFGQGDLMRRPYCGQECYAASGQQKLDANSSKFFKTLAGVLIAPALITYFTARPTFENWWMPFAVSLVAQVIICMVIARNFRKGIRLCSYIGWAAGVIAAIAFFVHARMASSSKTTPSPEPAPASKAASGTTP